jgi:hypothetical protein
MLPLIQSDKNLNLKNVTYLLKAHLIYKYQEWEISMFKLNLIILRYFREKIKVKFKIYIYNKYRIVYFLILFDIIFLF